MQGRTGHMCTHAVYPRALGDASGTLELAVLNVWVEDPTTGWLMARAARRRRPPPPRARALPAQDGRETGPAPRQGWPSWAQPFAK